MFQCVCPCIPFSVAHVSIIEHLTTFFKKHTKKSNIMLRYTLSLVTITVWLILKTPQMILMLIKCGVTVVLTIAIWLLSFYFHDHKHISHFNIKVLFSESKTLKGYVWIVSSYFNTHWIQNKEIEVFCVISPLLAGQ